MSETKDLWSSIGQVGLFTVMLTRYAPDLPELRHACGDLSTDII